MRGLLTASDPSSPLRGPSPARGEGQRDRGWQSFISILVSKNKNETEKYLLFNRS
jgi:hypothetical protein